MNKTALVFIILTLTVLFLNFPARIELTDYQLSWDFWVLDDVIEQIAQLLDMIISLLDYLYTIIYYVFNEAPTLFKFPLLILVIMVVMYAMSFIAQAIIKTKMV